MAVKNGFNIGDIRKLVDENRDLLNQGDITSTYMSMMTNMTPEELDDAGKRDVAPEISKRAVEENTVAEINLDLIQESRMNTFRPYPEEDFEVLKRSIENIGLLEPIIVRPKKCCRDYELAKDFEIIAGHNRYRACRELGLDKIKCAIVEVDDVTASLMINQSNIQREISEIEIAKSYRQTYDLMKKQHGGDRRSEEFSSFHHENLKMENEEDEKTIDELAAKCGIASATLWRKLRLTELDEAVLEKYEKKKITQGQAVSISFLEPYLQKQLIEENYSSTNKSWITDEIADELKDAAKAGALNPVKLESIMNKSRQNPDQDKPKEKKYVVSSKVFPEKLKKKDRALFVEAMVDYICENHLQEEILEKLIDSTRVFEAAEEY